MSQPEITATEPIGSEEEELLAMKNGSGGAPEAEKEEAQSVEEDSLEVSEEEDSLPLFKLFYGWMTPMFSRGWVKSNKREILVMSDLLTLPSNEKAEVVVDPFAALWEAEVAAFPEDPKLFKLLVKANMSNMVTGGIFRFLSDGCAITAPFLLREVVRWFWNYMIDPDTTNDWEGYVWVVSLTVCQFLITFFNNASLFYTSKAFANMRTSVVELLFRKGLKLDSDHGATGQAVQMHTTDSFKFIELSLFFHQLWAAPLLITGALIALYFFIGWAGVLSICVMFLAIPFQTVVMKNMMQVRTGITHIADSRLKSVNEFLQGIRVVKFMTWEPQFEKRIEEIREEERSEIGSMFFFRSIIVIMIAVTPMLVLFAVFAIAYALGDPMNPVTMFPTVAMLNVLRMPITMLPMSLGKVVDLMVSLTRVRAFLLRDEKKTYVDKDFQSKDVAIEVEEVTTVYIDSESKEAVPLLENVNLTIPKGKLTIVTGSTGCGKSTLMSILNGEARLSQGKVGVDGETAFVTQEAWIMNATLKENILFGKKYEEAAYESCVNSCQLISDLKELPDSDSTEIGERGVNLSGGQKQRIALARSVYSDRDIILMDDPLSAVDAHVCKAIFDECISGALKGKTRVLVTHQVQFLPEAEHIVVMDKCKVIFCGTYTELLNSTIDLGSLISSDSPAASPKASGAEDIDTLFSPVKPNNPNEKESSAVPTSTNSAKGDKLMTTELQVQGSIKAGTFGWYFRIQSWPLVLLTWILFIIWRVVTIGTELMMSWWATRSDVVGYKFNDNEYLLWYFIFFVLLVLFSVLRQVPFVYGLLNATRHSNSGVIKSLLRAPSSFFDTTPTGRIMSRCSKDLEAMDLVIPESINIFYQLAAVILGAIGLMIYTSPWLSIALFGLIIVYVMLFRFYSATNRATKRMEAINRSPMTSVMSETLGGLPTIRSYDRAIMFLAKHSKAVNLSSRSIYCWRNSQRWMQLRVDTVSSTIVLFCGVVTVAVFQRMSKADQVDQIGVTLLSITYSIAVSGAIGYLTTMAAELESALSSVERIKEYSDDLPQEREIEYGSGGPDDEFPPPGEKWPTQGAISFHDVTLRYREGLPLVLKGLSFSVKGGEKIGLVGRTGSGKSTIMLALFRMVELASGHILIDGHNTNNLKMFDLRRVITIIPQDPVLFQGTIRSNMDPFDAHSDEAIWSALRKVGMEERVKRDCDSLNTPVQERGVNYSVGQRQLLCLSRALLESSKILLLDEATASVDFESDTMIQKAIRNEFTHCTVLTIAHRLATIMDSDRVAVLDHGVLAEYDTPLTLLNTVDSSFRHMVQKLGDEQFGQMMEIAKESDMKKHHAGTNTL